MKCFMFFFPFEKKIHTQFSARTLSVSNVFFPHLDLNPRKYDFTFNEHENIKIHSIKTILKIVTYDVNNVFATHG